MLSARTSEALMANGAILSGGTKDTM